MNYMRGVGKFWFQYYTWFSILRFHLPEIFGILLLIVSKVGDCSRGQPEGSLFNSYYTEVWGRTILLSLDCSTLPLIHTLYCWVLSKEVSSTSFKVFGMMQPGIEPRSPGSLANTLVTGPWFSISELESDRYLIDLFLNEILFAWVLFMLSM